MNPLLDTHVLIWWVNGNNDRLSASQKTILESAGPGNPLLISDISLWEVAMLYSLGRVRLMIPLRDWLQKAAAPPLVRRIGISPAVAAEIDRFPESFHRDPADRIIVATARVLGATLLTQDRRIADAGLVPTLA
ncbi:MAG: type II toxin-antitoxin system VapC family toxin [Gammaproteobacteria bacterium]|nr:type II toxin-antitoxin system VapC family toxin [Gammaproteobacteria bacterium]